MNYFKLACFIFQNSEMDGVLNDYNDTIVCFPTTSFSCSSQKIKKIIKIKKCFLFLANFLSLIVIHFLQFCSTGSFNDICSLLLYMPCADNWIVGLYFIISKCKGLHINSSKIIVTTL